MSAPDAKDSGREPSKSAVPPVIVKKGKSNSDDEGDDKPGGDGVHLKQKFLPTGLSRAIVLAAVLASLAVLAGDLFGSRYNLVPAPNSTNGFMYRLDRLTGAVQFCGPQGCTDLPKPGDK
jgi:hypothetical protein